MFASKEHKKGKYKAPSITLCLPHNISLLNPEALLL